MTSWTNTRPKRLPRLRMRNADALARYFQLLIARLTNNEEIDEEAQQEMAREAAIDERRIDDIANFLNQWGNE